VGQGYVGQREVDSDATILFNAKAIRGLILAEIAPILSEVGHNQKYDDAYCNIDEIRSKAFRRAMDLL
jgi:hypothetical protein